MTGPDFLDTKVLVYAYDSGEPHKSGIARALVMRALNGEMIISAQVLAELASTLLHKISQPKKPDEVDLILDVLSPIKAIMPDVDLIRRAVQARAQYGVHFYDGMILAAAERGGCRTIWTEDLNTRQFYFGIVVENPFS
jgi:predicted nucleic acid-binding protein